MTDPVLTDAYCRAYNRWIADFCRDSGGRLNAVAHLSLLDPDAAAAELRRAVADGCVGAWIAPFTHTRKAHGHPDHDVVWRTAVELDVPVAVHPTYEPGFCAPRSTTGPIPCSTPSAPAACRSPPARASCSPTSAL